MSVELFGRFDAATLLAVERANGGELAALEQVLSTFVGLFGRPPGSEEFAGSAGLLADAGLVEYEMEALGLTPAGRRFLRRAGAGGASDRPAQLLRLLSELEEVDLAPEGSRPAPTSETVAAALVDLEQDTEAGNAPVSGDLLAPHPINMWGYGSGELGRGL